MELLDFKTYLILKRKFDELSSVPGTYDVIKFWRFLPCENFPELRKCIKSYIRIVARKCSIGGFTFVQGD